MRTRVKICGVTRVRDARLAVSLGASMIGCVMAADSKRRATIAEAAAIVRAVGGKVPVVLVYRRVKSAEVVEACRRTGAGVVQLHGAWETTCARIEEHGIKVIRVRRIARTARKLPELIPAPARGRLFLLDSGSGGTGRTFDWSVLGRRAPAHVYVAGGINPENVEALMRFRPYGIDLAGGVEASPGVKDARHMRALFKAVGGVLLASRMSSPKIGAFGNYGGRYVPELLWAALEELSKAHKEIVPGVEFQAAFAQELAVWAGRPTPLTEVPRFSEGTGARIVLKREDLLHGGAHKTNNVVGQGLLAKFLGKKRLIAETGAGQHGVATAMMGARLGMETVVYMGAVDIERQLTNVRRMELCGAKVIPVTSGSATLKDAINEALRDWAESVGNTHYLLGTVCGPDPFPSLVRDFQRVIGRETGEQWATSIGGVPDAVIACVGGGSNAIGIFSEFIDNPKVALLGAEPGGEGIESGRHGATLCAGSRGLLHGARTYVMQDADGQVVESHSISAGLDYPGVGPEHAMLRDSGRAKYVPINDDEAIEAFKALSRTEGIVPAFESAHALALASTAVKRGLLQEGARIVVNLSGRGDKDIPAFLKLQEGVRP